MHNRDIGFVLDAYSDRLAHARSAAVTQFRRESERELLTALDDLGRPVGASVPSGAAHRLGIIHRTADVIAANARGEMLLQQRAHDDPMFPSYFTLSAGGHCVEDEPPLDAARRELEEELGIYVADLNRFVRIHSGHVGIPSFYREWRISDGMTRCWQFRPGGMCHFGTLSPDAARAEVFWPPDWADWRALLSSSPDSNAQLVYLNQEFACYYLLQLTDQEIASVLSRATGGRRIRVVSMKELVGIAKDPLAATDGLRCLQQSGRIQRIADLL